jgi:hypothetical protein
MRVRLVRPHRGQPLEVACRFDLLEGQAGDAALQLNGSAPFAGALPKAKFEIDQPHESPADLDKGASHSPLALPFAPCQYV